MARKAARKRSSKKAEPWHAVPLKGSVMATAIIGFFVTAYLVYPKSPDFGIAFMLVFVVMFVASMISMTKAPVN